MKIALVGSLLGVVFFRELERVSATRVSGLFHVSESF
jgi:hypothetical protein